MRARLLSGLSAVALIFSLGFAAAQQAAPQSKEDMASPQQKSSQEKAQHSEDGRAGAAEPGAQTSTSENMAILVNGRLTAPGAPADSQAVPAKFSERNAALDALPTMAFPLPLNDDQKRRIMEAIGKTQAPALATGVTLHPADQVPSTVKLSEFPQDVTAAIPDVAAYRYLRTEHGILLVRAPTMTVVGEIAN